MRRITERKSNVTSSLLTSAWNTAVKKRCMSNLVTEYPRYLSVFFLPKLQTEKKKKIIKQYDVYQACKRSVKHP